MQTSISIGSAYYNGEDVEGRIDTGATMVTRENMEEPDVAALLTPDLSILDDLEVETAKHSTNGDDTVPFKEKMRAFESNGIGVAQIVRAWTE